MNPIHTPRVLLKPQRLPARKAPSGLCTICSFENQHALEDRDLIKCARKLGLDADQMMADLTNATHTLRVREDIRSGARAGVNGTPTFFVNGIRFDAGVDYQRAT